MADANAFDPTPYLMKVKGGQLYLPVKYRLMWLREEHPDAEISTEMVHLDLDQQLAVFRALVSIPGRGSATGYGSETERDFPAGWIEKSETKAVGRALAALGFGTQFAVELDEGERVVDSPVQGPAGRGQGSGNGDALRPASRPTAAPRPLTPAASSGTRGGSRGSLKVVADAGADEQSESLRHAVRTGLAEDRDAAAKLPKTADEMSPEELEKTLTWLRNRAQRSG